MDQFEQGNDYTEALATESTIPLAMTVNRLIAQRQGIDRGQVDLDSARIRLQKEQQDKSQFDEVTNSLRGLSGQDADEKIDSMMTADPSLMTNSMVKDFIQTKTAVRQTRLNEKSMGVQERLWEENEDTFHALAKGELNKRVQDLELANSIQGFDDNKANNTLLEIMGSSGLKLEDQQLIAGMLPRFHGPEGNLRKQKVTELVMTFRGMQGLETLTSKELEGYGQEDGLIRQQTGQTTLDLINAAQNGDKNAEAFLVNMRMKGTPRQQELLAKSFRLAEIGRKRDYLVNEFGAVTQRVKDLMDQGKDADADGEMYRFGVLSRSVSDDIGKRMGIYDSQLKNKEEQLKLKKMVVDMAGSQERGQIADERSKLAREREERNAGKDSYQVKKDQEELVHKALREIEELTDAENKPLYVQGVGTDGKPIKNETAEQFAERKMKAARHRASLISSQGGTAGAGSTPSTFK